MYLVILTAVLIGHAVGGPVVSPPCGPVEGVVRQHSDSAATTNFLGIHYAKPPVGDRRFALPENADPWEEVRDATKYGDSCLSTTEVMRGGVIGEWIYDKYLANLTRTEDCLSLNLFLPGDISQGLPDNVPVLVYLYGGGFLFGSSAFRMYEGDWLAKVGQVIVVTVNYRLGMFGFFSTGNDIIRGNAGLYDQNMALKWVQDNIASFGGDPQRVTLFGQSAGGAGVGYHVVSPLSTDLFQRAIIMSGSSQDRGAVPEDYRETTEDLWAYTNCTGSTDEESLACLREVPAEDLLEVFILYSYFPLIDGQFVPDTPENLYKTGRFHRLPHIIFPSMVGTVPLESAVVFEASLPSYLDEGLDFLELDLFMTALVTQTGYENFDAIYEALEEFYLQDHNYSDPMSNLHRFCNMMTDFAFESPKGTVLGALGEYGVETYHYHFMKRANYYKERVYKNGAHHSNDVPFVFGAVRFDGILSTNVTEEEKMLSSSVMNSFLSFAKGGPPKFLENDGSEREWPRYSEDDKNYLEFDLRMTSENIKANLKVEEMYFWNDVLPTIGSK